MRACECGVSSAAHHTLAVLLSVWRVVHSVAQDFHPRKQLAYEMLRVEASRPDADEGRYKALLLRLLNGVFAPPAAGAAAAAPDAGTVDTDAACDLITACPAVVPEALQSIGSYVAR